MKVHACDGGGGRCDGGNAREAMLYAASRRASRTQTRTQVLGHARDCFGSRRCRGNANSHARGDIHNPINYSLSLRWHRDRFPFFFPRLFPSPPLGRLFPTADGIALGCLSLIVKVRHAFEQIATRYATEGERHDTREKSLLFFIHLITISFREIGLAYSFFTYGNAPETGRWGTRVQSEIHYSLNCSREGERTKGKGYI